MTKRLSIVFVAALTLGLAAGLSCGGDDDGDDGIALDDAEAAFYSAFCEVVMRCPEMMEFPINPFDDKAECVTFITQMMTDEGEGPGVMVAAAKAGQVRYDPAKAEECIGNFASMSCAAADGGLDTPACTATFTGLVANGESCTSDEVCAGGWCEEDASCNGTCKDAVAKDGDCTGYKRCVIGHECLDGTCQPYAAAPTAGQDCDWEISNGPCAYGLYCDGNSSKCAVKKSAGDDCDDGDACGPGLGCFGGTCKVPVFVADGADCDDEEGKMCDMFDGFVCTRDTTDYSPKTCAAAAKLGESCVNETDGIFIPCDMWANLYCDFGDTKKCAARKAANADCSEDDECLSDYCDQGKCYDDSGC